jgi:hypothetical protein
MCADIDTHAGHDEVATFQKGNEPGPLNMRVLVCPCMCGKKFWARVPGNSVWVETDLM